MYIKATIGCLAMCITLLCTGCASSENKGSSSAAESSNTSSAAEVKESEVSAESEADDSEAPEKDIPREETGPLLAKAAEVFQSGTYSYECTLTDSEGNVTEIVRHAAPDSFYQLQKNIIGESGSVRTEGQTYYFDKVCGLFTKGSEQSLESAVLSVTEQKLPHTSNHISKLEQQEYDIEEYTYTGETYITAFDFFFSKTDGKLKKYVTTYSVEGSDDIVEVIEFSKISSVADSSLFSTSVINGLKDYDEMTQEECQELFERLCDADEVSDSDMSAYGTSRDKLGKLTYDEITELVYTYGFDSVYESAKNTVDNADNSDKETDSAARKQAEV